MTTEPCRADAAGPDALCRFQGSLSERSSESAVVIGRQIADRKQYTHDYTGYETEKSVRGHRHRAKARLVMGSVNGQTVTPGVGQAACGSGSKAPWHGRMHARRSSHGSWLERNRRDGLAWRGMVGIGTGMAHDGFFRLCLGPM